MIAEDILQKVTESTSNYNMAPPAIQYPSPVSQRFSQKYRPVFSLSRKKLVNIYNLTSDRRSNRITLNIEFAIRCLHPISEAIYSGHSRQIIVLLHSAAGCAVHFNQ